MSTNRLESLNSVFWLETRSCVESFLIQTDIDGPEETDPLDDIISFMNNLSIEIHLMSPKRREYTLGMKQIGHGIEHRVVS
ncbi:hypothetical protein IW261DRAFT_1564690 [Armillaria novae-zelandiae]|uniref:Uncharacterized protein n=1 Tax=Armillaria novae-zelandiae TaxID=153914 RepID=A0AA39P821_9AGAR|nr:hypothetical protein IW261DRAFT_1564690 [Armillaria novae-zelandiae]